MYAGFYCLFDFILAARLSSGTGLKSVDLQKSKSASSSLSTHDQALYDEIVHDLFNYCAAHRVSHPTLSPSTHTSRTWAVIFRQAASWHKVEVELKSILLEDIKVILWKKRWKQRISDLRGLQREVHENHVLLNKSGLDPALLANCKKESEDAIKRIRAIVNLAYQELEVDYKDPDLNRDPQGKVLQYLTGNWLHLTVFADWPEVPMDPKDDGQLFVQIRQPEDDAADFGQYVNASTKAIFTIKEVGTVTETHSYGDDIDPFTNSYVKSFGIDQVHHDYECGADDQAAIKDSNLEDRLNHIVRKALNEVNQRLQHRG